MHYFSPVVFVGAQVCQISWMGTGTRPDTWNCSPRPPKSAGTLKPLNHLALLQFHLNDWSLVYVWICQKAQHYSTVSRVCVFQTEGGLMLIASTDNAGDFTCV